MWRCLLAPENIKPPPPPHQQLPALQKLRTSGGVWVVLLLRGGHFAAAVFRMRAATTPLTSATDPTASTSAPSAGTGGKAAGSKAVGQKDEFEGSYEVLAQKTFHRYVVRCAAGHTKLERASVSAACKDAGLHARAAGARWPRW